MDSRGREKRQRYLAKLNMSISVQFRGYLPEIWFRELQNLEERQCKPKCIGVVDNWLYRICLQVQISDPEYTYQEKLWEAFKFKVF